VGARISEMTLPAKAEQLNGLLIGCLAAVGIFAVIGSVVTVVKWHARQLAKQEKELRRRLSIESAPALRDSAPFSAPFGEAASTVRRTEAGALGISGNLQPPVMASRSPQKMAERRAIQEEKIRRHWAEPIDQAWAITSSRYLRADIETLMRRSSSFRLVDLDCRNTSCIASIQWPTMAAAQGGFKAVLTYPFETNCSRSILIPETADPNNPLDVPMVLDCQQWKANGSKPLESPAAGP
jgi:hypothetical protein